MSEHRDKQAIRVVRIDNDRGNLLSVTQSQVLPATARVGRLVNSISGRKIGPPQSFAAAHVDDVRI